MTTAQASTRGTELTDRWGVPLQGATPAGAAAFDERVFLDEGGSSAPAAL